MIRAWVFSDLHLDVGREPFELPSVHPACDLIIVAGDVCEGAGRAVEWMKGAGLDRTAPVVYVLGNHECYRGNRLREVAIATEAARGTRVHVLQDDAVEIVAVGHGRVRVLGATLWTDYRLAGEAWELPAKLAAAAAMNDHALISHRGRRWRPADAQAEHAISRAWLANELRKPFSGPTVVVTHHAPSSKSVHPRYGGDVLNAAFASDCDVLVEQADLWVHGHMHSAMDYRLGAGRVVCNPRGYAGREVTGFDVGKVVEIEDTKKPR